MPVYKCKVLGEEGDRLVRAGSAAQARAHLVQAETVTAEEMADLIEGGATVERATATVPAEPQTPPPPPPPPPPPGKEGK